MPLRELDLPMSDGKPVHLHLWTPVPEVRPKGILQIVHGVAEHGARYRDFARFLNEAGWIACADDHRGHGKTEPNSEDLGWYGERDGWNRLVEDQRGITQWLRREWPGLDVVLFGHSMGSAIARTYAAPTERTAASRVALGIRGLALSGTMQPGRLAVLGGRFLANRDVRAGKGRFRNPTINAMAFDGLNKRFRKGPTKKEWLSRDRKVVDAYVADPLCGFDMTSAAMRDFFEGLLYITSPACALHTPDDLPILLVAGEEDPVGEQGRMVEACRSAYERGGVENLTMKLYEGMRHEILNEYGKERVYQDILKWLDRVVENG